MKDIPPEVLLFLDNSIDAVEQLQVLLLLYSQPQKEWGLVEITQELRSTETSIAKRLDDLYRRKVLTGPPSGSNHKFTPASKEIAELMPALSQQYQLKPNKIIEAIYSRPNKAMKAFADAFNLRGGKS